VRGLPATIHITVLALQPDVDRLLRKGLLTTMSVCAPPPTRQLVPSLCADILLVPEEPKRERGLDVTMDVDAVLVRNPNWFLLFGFC
jgi:hypothetical protein